MSIKKKKFSFEFFPPRTPAMERKFWRAVGRLEALNPEFFSVTYGALGSGQEQSVKAVKNLCSLTPIPVAAHLTCVNASKVELNSVVDEFKSFGVSGFVALRGDGEKQGEPYTAHPEGYQSVPELVSSLSGESNSLISVAAYPEVHPQAKSADEDLIHLKNKLDAGASQALTQYFYDADLFLRFRDKAADLGITQPIIPGILPIHSYERVLQFSKACGATLPTQFAADYERYKDDPDATYALSVEQSVTMCQKLADEGVEQFHFYTLNLTDLSYSVCRQLI